MYEVKVNMLYTIHVYDGLFVLFFFGREEGGGHTCPIVARLYNKICISL